MPGLRNGALSTSGDFTKGKALPVDTSPSCQLDRQHRRVEGSADRLPIGTLAIAEERMRLVSREREEVIYTVGVVFGLQKWKVYEKVDV